MRITNQELNVRVKWLNKALNRSDERYTAGNIFIDCYSPDSSNPYAYKLAESNEDTSIHEWTSYRMTRKEFYAYLNGLCDMLDLMRGYKPS